MLKSITRVRKVRSLTATFWLGFVMSISFMDTPLKFSTLSMSAGLSLGRVVFSTLNLCEWGFMGLIGITLLLGSIIRFATIMIGMVCSILLLQTLWLLPAASMLHRGYVSLEVFKMVFLFIIGWYGLTQQPSTSYRRKYL